MPEHKCVNDERIRRLEQQEAVMGVKLDNLTKELEKLTSTLKTLVWLSIPVVIGILGSVFALLGFLIKYWVKG